MRERERERERERLVSILYPEICLEIKRLETGWYKAMVVILRV